ncbi:MAG TPA: hypothetical protein VFL83_07240 [Anaeromyxobacter sp.]|nr:hypothetical protein [Anaeromyxobacter sp.]
MRTRSRLTAALTSTLLAACSRDVTLPPEPTAPQIRSVAPAAGFAGERIAIVASGLDAAPERNLVQFPSAVARGESLAGDALVVRVPEDAGSGPITVESSGGVSAPSSPFAYRGLGQLRSGAVAGEVPLLHEPWRLVAAGGDTFLVSDLLVALVRYADFEFVRDLALSVDALPPPAAAVVWLASDWTAGTSRLERLDVATDVVTAVAELDPFAGAGPVVALRGPSAAPAAARIAVLRSAGTGVTLALHDADTLAVVQAPEALPSVSEVRGCADAGEGRLACLVRGAGAGPLSLALVTPGGTPAVETIALPEGDAVQEDPVDVAAPICAEPTFRTAAVALADGRIAVATLDPPASWRYLETGSRTPARSLACAAVGAPVPRLVVLAPKRADDLVIALDAEAAPPGRILWSATVPLASRAAFDASAGTVHAAGEADNRVLVLDAGSGTLLARRSFDVLPGRVGAVQGATWMTADAVDPASLVFAVASPPGVLDVPLTAAPGTFPLYYEVPDAVGAFGAFAPYDPDFRYYFTLRTCGVEWMGTLVGFDPCLETQLGQDGPEDAYVGTAGGLVTLDFPGMTPRRSAIPGAKFASLGLLPAGGVFGAVRDAGGGWTVRAWSEAGAAAELPAERTWASPGEIAGAAVLDGALWAFHRDAAGAFVATRLDGALAPVGSVPMAEAFARILAVSPNGRTFVTWEYQPYSQDTSVVVWGAGAGAWERAATVPVEGLVSGVAFSGSGEALYVLTRAPDRVVVLE